MLLEWFCPGGYWFADAAAGVFRVVGGEDVEGHFRCDLELQLRADAIFYSFGQFTDLDEAKRYAQLLALGLR